MININIYQILNVNQKLNKIKVHIKEVIIIQYLNYNLMKRLKTKLLTTLRKEESIQRV